MTVVALTFSCTMFFIITISMVLNLSCRKSQIVVKTAEDPNNSRSDKIKMSTTELLLVFVMNDNKQLIQILDSIVTTPFHFEVLRRIKPILTFIYYFL